MIYDFSGIDKMQDYDRVVIFFDFGNNGDDSNYYFDNISLSSGSGGGSNVLALPLDFESSTLNYSFVDFGNVTSTVVSNPDASGSNTSTNVAQSVKPTGAEVWGGSFIQLDGPIDFSTWINLQ